jgi:hypothetical protein
MPVHSGPAKLSSFRTPTSAAKRPATSGVPAAPNKPSTRAADSDKNSSQVPAQSSSSLPQRDALPAFNAIAAMALAT